MVQAKDNEAIIPEAPIAWPVFICYRRVDGSKLAEAVYKSIEGYQFETLENNKKTLVEVKPYLDTERGSDSDYKKTIERHIDHSKAFILIVSPGVRSETKEDLVKTEILRWIERGVHDDVDSAPILISSIETNPEDWIPEIVRKKWPNNNIIQIRSDDVSRTKKTWNFSNKLSEKIRDSLEEKTKSVHQKEIQTLRKTIAKQRRLVKLIVLLTLVLAIFAESWMTARKESFSLTQANKGIAVNVLQENFELFVDANENDKALLHAESVAQGLNEFTLKPESFLWSWGKAVEQASAQKVYLIPTGTEVYPTQFGFVYFDAEKKAIYVFDGKSAPQLLYETNTIPVAIIDYQDKLLLGYSNGRGELIGRDGNLIDTIVIEELINSLNDQVNEDMLEGYSFSTKIPGLMQNVRNEFFVNAPLKDQGEIFSRKAYALDINEDCQYDSLSKDARLLIQNFPIYENVGCKKLSPQGLVLVSGVNGGSGGSWIHDLVFDPSNPDICSVRQTTGDTDYLRTDNSTFYRVDTINNQLSIHLYYLFDTAENFDEPDSSFNQRCVGAVATLDGEYLVEQINMPAKVELARFSPDTIRASSYIENSKQTLLVYLKNIGELRAINLSDFSIARSTTLQQLNEEDIAEAPWEKYIDNGYCGWDAPFEPVRISDQLWSRVYWGNIVDLELGISPLSEDFEISKVVMNLEFWIDENIKHFLAVEGEEKPNCISVFPDSSAVGLLYSDRIEIFRITADGDSATLPEPTEILELPMREHGYEFRYIDSRGSFVHKADSRVTLYQKDEKNVYTRNIIFQDLASNLYDLSVSESGNYILVKSDDGARNVSLYLIATRSGFLKRFGPNYKWIDGYFDDENGLWVSGGTAPFYYSFPNTETLVQKSIDLLSPHCRVEDGASIETSPCWE